MCNQSSEDQLEKNWASFAQARSARRTKIANAAFCSRFLFSHCSGITDVFLLRVATAVRAARRRALRPAALPPRRVCGRNAQGPRQTIHGSFFSRAVVLTSFSDREHSRLRLHYSASRLPPPVTQRAGWTSGPKSCGKDLRPHAEGLLQVSFSEQLPRHLMFSSSKQRPALLRFIAFQVWFLRVALAPAKNCSRARGAGFVAKQVEPTP